MSSSDSVGQALEDVILRHKDMVYRLAMLRMKNRSDADDVFQNVFVRYVRHAAQLTSEEHIRAWLIRVTINCCNSLYADAYRKRAVPYMDETAADDDTLPAPDAALCAEDDYGVEGDGASVVDAVKRLPPAYRDVIYLFYFEELSVRQIAQTLRVTEGAVKTRLSRARDMLRAHLSDLE